jgi:hypothetical protein
MVREPTIEIVCEQRGWYLPRNRRARAGPSQSPRKALVGVIEEQQPDQPIPVPEPDVVRPPIPPEEPQPDVGPGLPQPGPDVVIPPGPEVITPPRPQEIPPERPA